MVWTTIRMGDVIDFLVPVIMTGTCTETFDKYYSGKFLITKDQDTNFHHLEKDIKYI